MAKIKLISIWTITICLSFMLSNGHSQSNKFICPPCDQECDSLLFLEDGICPHCKMNLIMDVDSKTFNNIVIKEGSGNFWLEGGEGHAEKPIRVFYYRPSKFNNNSKTIIVLPGSGRNGDQYRDAWVEASEQYNILVLSLEYSQKYYPEFWSYNLAGMLTDVEINQERTAMTDFKISETPNEWIFNDFDRIFNLVKKELDLNSDKYDIFGHSAGGQILHRLAIFKPKNQTNRIVASNAGWYTVPNITEDFPVGLKNTSMSTKLIDFSNNLILFLGDKDDGSETRGDLRRSPEVDKQGLHRLARGRYFFQNAEIMSRTIGLKFNWKLEIVPNVGHDFKEMSKAAAAYLYESKK